MGRVPSPMMKQLNALQVFMYFLFVFVKKAVLLLEWSTGR
jgi:hypothetical protein